MGVDLDVGSECSTYRTDSEANRDGGDNPLRLVAVYASLTVHDAPSGAFFLFMAGERGNACSGNDFKLLILFIFAQGVP